MGLAILMVAVVVFKDNSQSFKRAVIHSLLRGAGYALSTGIEVFLFASISI